jgi:regulator of replication initiation timing
MESSLNERLTAIVDRVSDLVAELVAAEDLNEELLAENERLRQRLVAVEGTAAGSRVA